MLLFPQGIVPVDANSGKTTEPESEYEKICNSMLEFATKMSNIESSTFRAKNLINIIFEEAMNKAGGSFSFRDLMDEEIPKIFGREKEARAPDIGEVQNSETIPNEFVCSMDQFCPELLSVLSTKFNRLKQATNHPLGLSDLLVNFNFLLQEEQSKPTDFTPESVLRIHNLLCQILDSVLELRPGKPIAVTDLVGLLGTSDFYTDQTVDSLPQPIARSYFKDFLFESQRKVVDIDGLNLCNFDAYVTAWNSYMQTGQDRPCLHPNTTYDCCQVFGKLFDPQNTKIFMEIMKWSMEPPLTQNTTKDLRNQLPFPGKINGMFEKTG